MDTVVHGRRVPRPFMGNGGAQRVVPRLRHFGVLANYCRSVSIDLCRKLLEMAPLVRSSESVPTNPSWLCPRCQAPLIVILRLTAAQLFWRFSSNSFTDSS